MEQIFFPRITMFFHFCSLLIFSYMFYSDNAWYMLLMIPAGIVDSFMVNYYFYQEDDEEDEQ